MKEVYTAATDELVLQIYPVKGRANKKAGPLKLWWDDEGNICAIAITKYSEELEEFRKKRNTVQLGGIWKGVSITDEHIRETREELLEKLGEK